MGRFGREDTVRVLVSWSVVSDQVGTVLDIVERSSPAGEDLYLVKFPDRFMGSYWDSELGPALSRKSGHPAHN